MLMSKNKLNVYEPINNFLARIADIQNLEIVQISPNIAADSSSLSNFHGDPADRIITATTRELSGTLITRDEKIINCAKNGSLKVMHC